jgi:hypothetical protein
MQVRARSAVNAARGPLERDERERDAHGQREHERADRERSSIVRHQEVRVPADQVVQRLRDRECRESEQV